MYTPSLSLDHVSPTISPPSTSSILANEETTTSTEFSTHVVRHEINVIVNRNRLQAITVFWVIVIDWTDQKLNVIVIDHKHC